MPALGKNGYPGAMPQPPVENTSGNTSENTVEAWALAYVRSTALQYKLQPPAPPRVWAAEPQARRLACPGRPPELRVQESRVRSLEFLHQLLIWGTSLGAFGGLWKVVEVIILRHANAAVKISYTSEDGSLVEVSYTKLTNKEAAKRIAAHPPSLKDPMKVIVTR